MNKFLSQKMQKALENAENDKNRKHIFHTFAVVDSLGINDENGLKKYHYVSQLIPNLIKKVYGEANPILCYNVIKLAIDKLDDNFSVNDVKEIVCQAFVKNKFVKIAYPNQGWYNDVKPRDLNKWFAALNDIYMRTRLFGDKTAAFDYVTREWGDMDEKLDFKQWLKFYETGGDKAYKIAQVQLNLPFKPYPREPEVVVRHIPQEHKEVLDAIRYKILGRIQSAKKILNSNPGRTFAGQDYDKLLETLFTLEKDILRVKTASMLSDLFEREFGILKNAGCSELTKNVLVKIAQELPGLPGLPAPGAPATPATPAPTEDGGGEKALEEFGTALKDVVEGDLPEIKFEEKKEEPKPEAKPVEKKPEEAAKPEAKPIEKPASWVYVSTPELKVFEKVASNILNVIESLSNNFIVTAQAAPALPAVPPAPKPVLVPKPVPTSIPAPPAAAEMTPVEPPKSKKDEPMVSVPTPQDKRLMNLKNDVLDTALNSVTINDAVDRLQALSRVFKNREIARQLAIVDLMLDKLGISGFFPALAEATRSALESNQYCQTRVDEILSKLISAVGEGGSSLIRTMPGKNKNMVNTEMNAYLNEDEVPVDAEPVKPNTPPVVV